ncbi:MAG: hypothetical protein M0R03_03670, partial [Novosphingobium sp.]|nr:hypothetical protein [Novosphingobium sp.]
TIYLENGAESLEIGKEYFIEVYPKTEWGLFGNKIEMSVTLVGKNIPPTPVFFTDSSGTPITSKTFEKEFDLTWEFSVDADDDTYELRYGNISSTWETATFLWQGRAEKYIWQPDGSVLTSNTVRVWIKSRNRSKLEQTDASYIDCTNNAPSTPNTPTIITDGSIFTVTIEEKNTINDKDIINYELYRVINGVEDTIPTIVQAGNTQISVDGGTNLKCRIKAVDMFGQKSSFSNYCDIKTLFLLYSQNSVTIFPSGDSTGLIDSQNIFLANEYLKSFSGGSINLSSGAFYIKYSVSIPNLIDMTYSCLLSGSGATELNIINSTAYVITNSNLSISNLTIKSSSYISNYQISSKSISKCNIENLAITANMTEASHFTNSSCSGSVSNSEFTNSNCSGSANYCNFNGDCDIFLGSAYGLKYKTDINTTKDIYIEDAVNCDFFHSYVSTTTSEFRFGFVNGCNFYMQNQNININGNVSRYSFVTRISNSYLDVNRLDVNMVVEIVGSTILCSGFYGNPIVRVFGAPPMCGVRSTLGDISISSSTVSCSSFDNGTVQQYDTCLSQNVIDSFNVILNNSSVSISGLMTVNGSLVQNYSNLSYGSFSNPYSPAGRHYI